MEGHAAALNQLDDGGMEMLTLVLSSQAWIENNA